MSSADKRLNKAAKKLNTQIHKDGGRDKTMKKVSEALKAQNKRSGK